MSRSGWTPDIAEIGARQSVYDAAQAYRHAPAVPQSVVIERYHDLIATVLDAAEAPAMAEALRDVLHMLHQVPVVLKTADTVDDAITRISDTLARLAGPTGETR